jgi:transcriptional regulator with XRE-family HTH domain
LIELKTKEAKENIKRRIESQMKLKAINTRQLAERLGITETSCYNRLNGRIAWRDYELLMMASLFDVSIDYLIGLNDGQS